MSAVSVDASKPPSVEHVIIELDWSIDDDDDEGASLEYVEGNRIGATLRKGTAAMLRRELAKWEARERQAARAARRKRE